MASPKISNVFNPPQLVPLSLDDVKPTAPVVDVVTPELCLDICHRVYQQGKTKDVFVRISQNHHTVTADLLQTGLLNLGIKISINQSNYFVQRYAADKNAMTYGEFIKMLTPPVVEFDPRQHEKLTPTQPRYMVQPYSI